MMDEPPKGADTSSDVNWWKVLAAPTGGPDILPPKVDPSQTEDTPPASRQTADAIQQETANDMVANRALREKYAEKAYQLAAGCISMWAVLLGAQGVIKAVAGVEMWTEKVIIAVTTGVTVSVLAAFLGVIRGLFPNGHSKESQKAGK